jgi:hypothetical protein
VPAPRTYRFGDNRRGGGRDRNLKDSPRRIVLVCEECGGKTVLDEPLSAWGSGETSFGCECAKQLDSPERLEPRSPDQR